MQDIKRGQSRWFVKIEGVLDFHRRAHGSGSHVEDHRNRLGEGQSVVFEDIGQIHDFRALSAVAGDKAEVLGIPGRNQIGEFPVLGSGVDRKFGQAGHFPGQELRHASPQVQGMEIPLGIVQQLIRRHHVQLWIPGAKAMGSSSPHDPGSQPKGGDAEAVLRFGIGYGVIVIGLRHAGNMGIVVVAPRRTHQFLDHHRHAFLFQVITGHFKVRARLGGEKAGEDQSYRIAELVEPHFGVGVIVGDYIGVVNAGKWHHEHILEEA